MPFAGACFHGRLARCARCSSMSSYGASRTPLWMAFGGRGRRRRSTPLYEREHDHAVVAWPTVVKSGGSAPPTSTIQMLDDRTSRTRRTTLSPGSSRERERRARTRDAGADMTTSWAGPGVAARDGGGGRRQGGHGGVPRPRGGEAVEPQHPQVLPGDARPRRRADGHGRAAVARDSPAWRRRSATCGWAWIGHALDRNYGEEDDDDDDEDDRRRRGRRRRGRMTPKRRVRGTRTSTTRTRRWTRTRKTATATSTRRRRCSTRTSATGAERDDRTRERGVGRASGRTETGCSERLKRQLRGLDWITQSRANDKKTAGGERRYDGKSSSGSTT